MKIKKPKRIMSLLLAALMCVTSLVGMGTTAYAAEETDDVYLISFPRDGDSNYNAEWGHGSHTFMNGWKTGTSRYTTVRAMGSYTGNICYCIEIGVPQQTGDSYTKKGEDFWDNYPSSYNSTISPDDIKLFIGRIFQYGYTGTISTSWRSQNEGGDKASIYINKELQRVNREILQTLDKKDVLFIFPHTLSNSHTVLVLKKPKTDTSERRVYLPKTVALMVREKIKAIEEIKELFGDEYTDYNLLFAHSSGRPIEGQVINRAMKKLIKENDLPDVVFHSVRHSSITYKLKWTGGDIKAVQGDSGHARAEMVQDVYSHILDEDRRANARRFDENFYQQKPEEAKEEVPQAETQNKTGVDPTALFQLLADPEMAKAFQNLLTIYQSKAANDK